MLEIPVEIDVDYGWQHLKKTNIYLYFKACFSGDTEDADDHESAESEAACSDDEPLDDDEEDTKLPGSTSR